MALHKVLREVLGTHVEQLGSSSMRRLRKIIRNCIAAGGPRVDALTGNGVIAYYKNVEQTLEAAAKVLEGQKG